MSENITRRSALATTGRAAVAVLGLGGLAVAAPALAGDDPIYAAIQANKDAFALLNACCSREPSAQAPEAERDAWHADEEACGDAIWETSWAMLEVEPATMAGVIAFLDHLPVFEGCWPNEAEGAGGLPLSFDDEFLGFVSRSLKRFLAGGLAS